MIDPDDDLPFERRSQLSKDLEHNARERLHLWVKDTFMRCEVAKLSTVEVAYIIVSTLLFETTSACRVLGLPYSTIIKAVTETYDWLEERSKRKWEDQK